jgi:S-adenosylmethionine hydrolase
MKGVILSINPLAKIIDLTHTIGKYNVREAALVIGMSYREFPQRTIHIVITDPGVGSPRRPLLVATDEHYFVGPDNGLFSMIYGESEKYQVYHVTAEHYFRRERSATFHGRDIFAPVAAWLSKGIESSNFGETITDYVKFSIPSLSMPTKTVLEGEVIYIDSFGNAMTNVKKENLETLRSVRPDGYLRCVMKGKDVAFKEYYSQAEDKGLYALVNSMNYVELYVYRGDAAKEHDIRVGDTIGIMVI